MFRFDRSARASKATHLYKLSFSLLSEPPRDSVHAPEFSQDKLECWSLLEQAVLALEDLQLRCAAGQARFAEQDDAHRHTLERVRAILMERDTKIAELTQVIAALETQLKDVQATSHSNTSEMLTAVSPHPHLTERLRQDRDVIRFKRHMEVVMAA